MNKGMIAAAFAVVAATSFADVEGGNIVGYVNKSTTDMGCCSVGGSFVSVGTKKINLVDIGVNPGGTGADYYCTVALQTLKTDGTTDKTYYYIYNKKHGGTSGTAGWYLDDVGTAGQLVTRETGIEFDPGTGFWVQGVGKQLTLSGEVLTSSEGISVATTALGCVMVANPYPFAVNLADIKVDVGGTGADFYCTVAAQTLKTDGTTDQTYYYIYNKKHGGTSGTAGWYKDDVGSVDQLITKADNIELPAGGAYWVQGLGKKIVFPAFTLDK